MSHLFESGHFIILRTFLLQIKGHLDSIIAVIQGCFPGKMNPTEFFCKTFNDSGRKITLKEIREKSIEEHKQFIRSFPDELYDDPEWVNKEYKRLDEPILPPLSA